MLICYETYDSARAKRRAQKGAKRGVVTGLADDYMLVDRDDYTSVGFGAIAPIYVQAVGSDCAGLSYCGVGHGFLRARCRRIGRKSMPAPWRESFRRYLRD